MLGDDNENSDQNKPDQDKPNLERKIGLVSFIQVSEPKPNKYVEAMLRSKYVMNVYTKVQWEQIVAELLNKKVK